MLLEELREKAKPRKEKTVWSNKDVKERFYHSSAWRKKRKEIRKRDHNECQVCKERFKVNTKDLIVHHINPLEWYPSQRLDSDNLITVCISCHNAIHYGEKNKWDDEWW